MEYTSVFIALLIAAVSAYFLFFADGGAKTPAAEGPKEAAPAPAAAAAPAPAAAAAAPAGPTTAPTTPVHSAAAGGGAMPRGGGGGALPPGLDSEAVRTADDAELDDAVQEADYIVLDGEAGRRARALQPPSPRGGAVPAAAW